jgi:taurine dioxygenase
MNISAPPHERIGAEVTDLHLGSLDERDVEVIRGLVYTHTLVVFRGQSVTNEEYIRFARALGTPQIYFQPHYHHPDHPEIFVSSNVLLEGRKVGVAGTGRYWHTDYQFFEEPLPLTLLYPQQLPEVNRETYYIDMERVYRELPADLRARLDGTTSFHEAKWRYKVQEWDIDRAIIDIIEEFSREVPGARHPTVITHPVTKARSLYVSEGFTTAVSGMSYEENRALLERLFAHIRRDEHVHTHRWAEGDILLWDNRALLHKASSVPKGQPSVSYRIGVYDGLPFYLN